MRSRTLAAAALAAGLVAAGVVVTTTAAADTTICDTYGSTRTAGGYVAQNNRWGADTPQCISVSGDGLTLTTSQANKPTNGAPAAYPSLFWGCHYGTCTTGFSPVQASASRFGGLATSARFGYVDQGVWNASYDLWFDPTPRTDGQNTGAELMIWLNRRGSVQPIGGKVATVRLGDADWDVWFGNIGWNVVSYVRTTPSTGLSTTVDTFYGDAVRRGYAQRSWYLTSVQAGFEPWVGGAGLSLSSFSVTEGTPTTPTPTTPTPTTPVPTTPVPTTPVPTTPAVTTPAPAPAVAACRITTRRDEWPGGFVRYVTLTNTSTTALTGWALTLRLAAGQQLTNGWSAVWQQDGGRLTARNLDWNARIAPGGSVDVGFQGAWTGANPEPEQWELNGTPCSRG